MLISVAAKGAVEVEDESEISEAAKIEHRKSDNRS